MATPTQIVQDIYAAFGRGDVPAIVGRFADDIRFVHSGGPQVPYAKDRHGKEQAAAFFAELAELVEVTAFEVGDYVAQGEKVVALGHWAGRAKRTGNEFAGDWAMLWVFDGDKVRHYQSFENTAAVAAAFG